MKIQNLNIMIHIYRTIADSKRKFSDQAKRNK